jgi:hypothetical protein
MSSSLGFQSPLAPVHSSRLAATRLSCHLQPLGTLGQLHGSGSRPRGAERTSDNLTETIVASTVPEATMPSLMLLGLTGLFLRHWLRHMRLNEG